MLRCPMGFHHDGQAGLELLTSGDPPTLASQSARITGTSHCIRPATHSYLSVVPLTSRFALVRKPPYISPDLVVSFFLHAEQELRTPLNANWEIPGRGATRVTSATLLAGAAVLTVPRCGVYRTDGLGWSHPHKENSNWKH
ncbi:hypothetical protein AAY473_032597 [Plecturocebus cupreus]